MDLNPSNFAENAFHLEIEQAFQFLCDQIVQGLHEDSESPIVSARHVFNKLSSRVKSRSNNMQNPLYGQLFEEHFEQKCHGEFFFTLPKQTVIRARGDEEIKLELEAVEKKIKELRAQRNEAEDDENEELAEKLGQHRKECVKQKKRLQEELLKRPSTPSGSGLNVVRAKRGE